MLTRRCCSECSVAVPCFLWPDSGYVNWPCGHLMWLLLYLTFLLQWLLSPGFAGISSSVYLCGKCLLCVEFMFVLSCLLDAKVCKAAICWASASKPNGLEFVRMTDECLYFLPFLFCAWTVSIWVFSLCHVGLGKHQCADLKATVRSWFGSS